MKRTLALVTFAALFALFALESPAPAGRIIAELVLPDNPTGKRTCRPGRKAQPERMARRDRRESRGFRGPLGRMVRRDLRAPRLLSAFRSSPGQ
jgi:hypothetical protein